MLGKVLEEAVCERLEAEVGGNLSADQHGFRPGKSTSTAQESLMGWVSRREERHMLGTFLDISGAFDNVRWSQLAQYMISIGCSGTTMKIIESYLTNRTASYAIGGYCKELRLARGAPQSII